MSNIIQIVILVLLGLIIGSFINAWVWRLSKQIDENGEPKKLTAKQKKDLSIVTARSMCPDCKHELGVLDLVPVFSWLILGGKCRYCKKPISKQYPTVELITAILFGLSAYFWVFTYSWQYVALVTWLACLVGLVALAVYDIKHLLLPDRIMFIMYGIAGLGLIAQFIFGRPLSDIKNVVSSVLICGGIFWVIYQVSKGKWIGGGDVKLGFLLGLLIAVPMLSFLMLFLASFLATIVSMPLLLSKKLNRSTKIPFGPFLIASTIITVLYGQHLLDWYTNLIIVSIS
ncbi:prepilin peptidase [Candidatus Saccharibacteria bacterium]|nr:prepilin peptidase [Candidatus Saccharibacteria bacterium]